MSQPSEQNPESRRTAAAPAGIARRLGALVYDSLLILAIWMMTALVAVLISGEAVNPIVMQMISVAEVIALWLLLGRSRTNLRHVRMATGLGR